MLRAYVPDKDRLKRIELTDSANLPLEAVWLDLEHPTRAEELLVESTLGIEVPTRQEMQEIEASSRLYREADAWYMTATVIVMADTPHPEGSAVTFILVKHRLVTLRYTEPRAFKSFAAHSERQPSFCTTGEVAFVGLLEAIVDRTADILEQVSADMDLLSQRIFTYDPSCQPAMLSGNDFQEILCRIGRNQYLIAKARESLVSLSRLLSFLALPGDVKHSEDLRPRVKTLSRDILSLTDHTAYISGNVTFLLDALLGMINIQQNGIIKIVSVAAVVFLPPTVVASIYGMNFGFMPELDWPLGYPFAILVMIVSAILPYFYFKRRGWL